MKKTTIKFIGILTTIALVFQSSGFSNIYANPIELNNQIEIEQNKEIKENELPKKQQDEISMQLNQDVRLIVELQGEPVIAKAINQGISYSELTKDEIEKSEEKIDLEQEQALEDLKKSLPNLEEDLKDKKEENDIIKYNTSFNGLAISVKPEDIPTIKNKNYVKNVYISEEYERPQMKHSNQTIGSQYVWDTKKYKGEGTVVAIIDSGLDYRHVSMTLDDETKAKYNEDEINKLIRENNLKGKYFTSKVPYGYNYYDHNYNTLDSYGVMHGMHVSGTVGANSSKSGQIDGVAPNTQLLALKVFSDDLQYPTTFTDIWLKALDDAITLKADVINMSLGSAAGIASNGERPEDVALQRAKEAGIVVAIAAGNDSNIMSGYFYKDKSSVDNPDTSLIASPSLLENSISVASIENKVRYVNKLHWNLNRVNINLRMGNNEKLTAKAIDLGEGQEKDYENKDVKNKIVLIKKTENKQNTDSHHNNANTIQNINSTTQTSLNLTDKLETINDKNDINSTSQTILQGKEKEKEKSLSLGEKIILAQNKGASAIIIYNDDKSGEKLGVSLKFSPKITDLPLAIIGYSGGQKLINDIKQNPNTEVTLSDKLEEEPNLTSGEVSFFSSWGPTPDLRIKPEVSAPGGYIYSTAEENKYQNMSGTSMASPHVAGASAILKQYLNEEGINSQNSSDLIKLLLMNTALPVQNAQKNIDFVRKQGAGIIRLDKAIETKVTVTATGTNDNIQDGKLELRELKQDSFNFNLKLKNIGDKDKKYQISSIGIYEIVENERLSEKAGNIENFGDLNQEIDVKANSTTDFSYNISLSPYSQIRKNSFVEGYIILKDMEKDDDSKIDLTIPFLAYYGDWGEPKAIDAFEIKEKNISAKRQPQVVINKDENAYGSLFFSANGLRLPIVNDKIYFYPDTYRINKNNYYPLVAVRLTPLRNMSKIEYSILDEETGEVLKVIGESQEVKKISQIATRPAYRVMSESVWNGLINGREVTSEDKLIYQIKATLNNYTDKEETVQIYQYPVRVDKQSPVIDDNIKVTDTNSNIKKVEFSVQDIGSGLNNIYIQSVYFKRRFPSTAPGEKPNPKDDEPVDPKEIGDNPNLEKWKPQYGKYQRIVFVDKNNIKSSQLSNPNSKILKVENNTLVIPENMSKENSIICDINGHENEKVNIVSYYEVEQPYLEISVGDHLANRSRKITSTGYKGNSYKLTFLNYAHNLKPYDAIVKVNGKDVSYETSVSGKAEVYIDFPKKNSKITFLKIVMGRTEEILIENDKINPKYKDKYKVEISDSKYRFTIQDNSRNISIITTTQKIIPDSEKANLSFEDIDLSKFYPIAVEGQTVKEDKKILSLKKGQLEIITGLKDIDNKIQSISLQSNSGRIRQLIRMDNYGLYSQKTIKNAYYYDEKNGDLYIKIDLKVNSKFIIKFKDKNENSGDLTNSNSSSPDNDKNRKYPVVFLRTPDLLDIKTERNIGKNGFAVDGFIGYVDEQGLEKLIISLVDEKGNVIGDSYDYPMDKVQKRNLNYDVGGRRLYSGIGYEFNFEMKTTVFNTNLRIEAIAKNGEKASMVRRLFYDEEFPILSYEIMPRKLSDENMVLKIHSSDNSYKISLYKDDSYLDKVDLSKKTLEKGNVSYTKTFDVKLKLGQNKIVLKSADASGHETYKILYVYRSAK